MRVRSMFLTWIHAAAKSSFIEVPAMPNRVCSHCGEPIEHPCGCESRCENCFADDSQWVSRGVSSDFSVTARERIAGRQCRRVVKHVKRDDQ